MSSPLGDQLVNPAVKPAEDADTLSNSERFKRGIGEGLVELLELGTLPNRAIESVIGHVLKQSGLSDYIPDSLKEKVSKTIDLRDEEINKLREKVSQPEGRNYVERLSREAGRMLPGLAGGASGFARKGMRTLGNALAMGGGAAAQTLASPAIQEYAPNNPLIQVPLNLATGIGGALMGGGIGKAFSNKPNIPLPEMTAGQAAPFKSPESRKLLEKQLSLGKTDRKSAAILNEIQENQQNAVNNKFNFPAKIDNETVADELVGYLERLREEDTSAYNSGLEKVLTGFENAPNVKFDTATGKPLGRYKSVFTEKAFDEIEKIKNSETRELRDFADNLRKQIEAEEGNPVFLNSLKKKWGSEASYGANSPLHVGKPKQEIFKKVIHGLTEDMKEQIPGYREFMKQTADNIEKRNSIIEGVVGDYIKGSEKNPQTLLSKIFENPNRDVNNQIREMLPPETYHKAAQTFLTDLYEDTVGKSSWNQENLANNYYALRSALQNNRKALDVTLPDDLKQITKDVIEKVKVSERGVPRNEYTFNPGKSRADESVKNFGTTIGLGKKVAAKVGKNYLDRQEMLTGVSPMNQIKNSVKNPLIQTAAQANIANTVSDKFLPEGEKNQIQIPKNPNQNNLLDNMDAEDEEFMNFSTPKTEDQMQLEKYRENPFSDEDEEFMNFASNMKKGRK